jgi:hypothetical protein
MHEWLNISTRGITNAMSLKHSKRKTRVSKNNVQQKYRMTIFASVAITSFFVYLLNTLNNGLVPFDVCIKHRCNTDHMKAIYYHKLKTKLTWE